MPILSTKSASVVTGTFLAGSMMSLSIIAVPVLLDTADTPAHLVRQWERMYYYGHLIMPSLALSTSALHFLTYLRPPHTRPKNSSPHTRAGTRIFAVAGITTLVMLPFTWIIMAPTNNKLFALRELEVAGGRGAAEVGMSEVRGLLESWAWLHALRTLMPLSGALMAMVGTLRAERP